jgi:hypothetical protein
MVSMLLRLLFVALLSMLILFAGAMSSPLAHSEATCATCVGSDPCNACKNCKYCAHCAKGGGTCGVCR